MPDIITVEISSTADEWKKVLPLLKAVSEGEIQAQSDEEVLFCNNIINELKAKGVE